MRRCKHVLKVPADANTCLKKIIKKAPKNQRIHQVPHPSIKFIQQKFRNTKICVCSWNKQWVPESKDSTWFCAIAWSNLSFSLNAGRDFRNSNIFLPSGDSFGRKGNMFRKKDHITDNICQWPYALWKNNGTFASIRRKLIFPISICFLQRIRQKCRSQALIQMREFAT